MQLLPWLATSADIQPRLPRVGQIAFLNTLPVVLPMEKKHIGLAVETVYGSPSQLNASIQGGLLDLSAMSSFSFLKQADLALVEGLCIGSIGPVGSVLFFSKVEPQLLHSARIAITAASATSVNLLRILLSRQYGVAPQFVVQSEPDVESADYQGALVIGDMALAADSRWSAKYLRIDLGQWWFEHTGLPMVFGLWAARNEWTLNSGLEFQSISAALNDSLRSGLSELFEDVLREAQCRSGLPSDRLRQYYLEELSFDFTAEHHKGLKHYESLCRQHGLL